MVQPFFCCLSAELIRKYYVRLNFGSAGENVDTDRYIVANISQQYDGIEINNAR